MSRRIMVAAALLAISCLAFGIALLLPLFSIQPAAGRWTGIARLLASEDFRSQSFTLVGGIRVLWSGGEVFLALIIGALSLVLPVLKFLILWWEILEIQSLPDWLVRAFRVAARYAMVEVFLVALLVILLKGMPGGSQISLHTGMYAFSASVILSLIASHLLIGATRKPIFKSGDDG